MQLYMHLPGLARVIALLLQMKNAKTGISEDFTSCLLSNPPLIRAQHLGNPIHRSNKPKRIDFRASIFWSPDCRRYAQ